eukprot:sb/3461839/
MQVLIDSITSKQPIKTRCFGHVTGYQPIRDQYFLIESDPDIMFNTRKAINSKKRDGMSGFSVLICTRWRIGKVQQWAVNTTNKTRLTYLGVSSCCTVEWVLETSDPYLDQYCDLDKRPIRTRYLGHVTGYQPIMDQYFLIRSVPVPYIVPWPLFKISYYIRLSSKHFRWAFLGKWLEIEQNGLHHRFSQAILLVHWTIIYRLRCNKRSGRITTRRRLKCSVPLYCQHFRYKGILKSVRFQCEIGKRGRTMEGTHNIRSHLLKALIDPTISCQYLSPISSRKMIKVLIDSITSKQPIKTRCFGHVTGYQPIRDQYFLIESDPDIMFNTRKAVNSKKRDGMSGFSVLICTRWRIGKVHKQPIRTCNLRHVTGCQPIRDQYFLIRFVPVYFDLLLNIGPWPLFKISYYITRPGWNRPNQEILVPDWLITSHVGQSIRTRYLGHVTSSQLIRDLHSMLELEQHLIVPILGSFLLGSVPSIIFFFLESTVIRSNTRTRTRTTKTVTIILLVSWIKQYRMRGKGEKWRELMIKITNAPWIGILSLYLSSANLIINPFVYFFVCPRSIKLIHSFIHFIQTAAGSGMCRNKHIMSRKPATLDKTGKQPIRTRYLGNVADYQPIRDDFLIRKEGGDIRKQVNNQSELLYLGHVAGYQPIRTRIWSVPGYIILCTFEGPTITSKQPITTRHLGHVTGYCFIELSGARKAVSSDSTVLLYVLWVFELKTRISEGYSATPFHPIDLKFGMYTRLGVFYLSSKFQVSISSGSEVTEGSTGCVCISRCGVPFHQQERPTELNNQSEHSLFRSRDWLSANQDPYLVGSLLYILTYRLQMIYLSVLQEPTDTRLVISQSGTSFPYSVGDMDTGKVLSISLCTLGNWKWETSKQPIRTRYLGHVTGYQPIRDQYFLGLTAHICGN